MYLKELEIFGFKSFPEKTVLKFNPGISVVVGPNGCGKSNLLDGLRWALGEQSPKSLRGTKMEDIIFNGTQNHPALSYAQVTLNFDNTDHYLPLEYDQVSISRRVYRSGEGEYFINKNQVRLKDIEALFMGTGIGESTYSFVEQGKIEIFVGNKPEEKRLIFDEASGIIKYKESKREALRNLDQAQENLLRIEDIFNEVKRQIKFLERQVQKAESYKNSRQELINIELKLATINLNDLKSRETNLGGEINTLSEQETSKINQLENEKNEATNLAGQYQELRKNLDETNNLIASLNTQVESAFAYIEVCRKRIVELQERNNNIETSKIAINERIQLANSRLEGEHNRLKEIETQLQEASINLEALLLDKDNINKTNQEKEDNIDQIKGQILALESQKTNTHNSLIELQTQIVSLGKRQERLNHDRNRTQELLDKSANELTTLGIELKNKESALEIIRQEKDNLFNRHESLLANKETIKNKIIEQDKDLVESIAYYEFLKDLRVKYDTFSSKRNITIIFNEEPKDINKIVASLTGIQFNQEGQVYKAQVEAKVICFQETQLEEQIQLLRKNISDSKEELSRLEEDLKFAKEGLNAKLKDLEDKELDRLNWLSKIDNTNAQYQRLNDELSLIVEELNSLQTEMNNGQARQEQLNLEENNLSSQLDSVRLNLVSLQNETQVTTDRIQQIDIEIARKEEYRQALNRDKENLNSKILVLEEDRITNIKYLEDISSESEENLKRINSWEEELSKLNISIEEKKAQVSQHINNRHYLDEQEKNFLNVLEEKKKLIADLEVSLEEIKTQTYNKKIEFQSLEYEKNKITDYLKQVYELDFTPVVLNEGGEDVNLLNEEREKLKKRLKSLGEVNLACFDEFSELKKRQDFLDKQRQDLVDAKENLKKAINKINHTCRELFINTFTKVEEEFKNNFRYLFGGGKAKLILLDPENILESGVEIEVQPPGKKLQNVTLLSGGEKALTATALIFAIFKVRPSPLCVLDEIDAPLDEANVGRFNSLLKDFASSSQFLVITHNKRTMSIGDVLYGVTMQEKGVSKIVSVKLSQEEAKPQESPATA